MKIRNGHVTNSSSSSYIIALDKPTSGTVSTEQELVKYLAKYIGEDEEHIPEYSSYKEGIQFINQGKHIFFVSLSYSEPVTSNDLIKLLEKAGLTAQVEEMPL
jgi:hypothetical protein